MEVSLTEPNPKRYLDGAHQHGPLGPHRDEGAGICSPREHHHGATADVNEAHARSPGAPIARLRAACFRAAYSTDPIG